MQSPDDVATAVESLSYVTVRFTTFVSIVVVVGVAAFLSIVVPRIEGRGAREVANEMRARLRVLGLGACIALLALALARLALQRAMLTEAMGDTHPIALSVMLSGVWGVGLALQVVGAAAGLIAFGTNSRTIVSTLARGVSLVMVVSPSLSGHAAGEESSTLPIIADSLHVLAAGAWAGLLLALAVVALPVVRRRAGGDSGPIVRELLFAFSPVALGSAAVLAATGAYAAWLHLSGVASLWTTRYGQALVSKLALVAVMALIGAVNWRRNTPRVMRPGGVGRLSRAAWLELAVAMLIILVTAVLVGRRTPADM